MPEVTGQLVEVEARRIVPATVTVEDGRIAAITPADPATAERGPCLLPGFVDAHVHVESSMLTPSRFAAAAVRHGTVATVSDPHEIANVLGVDGVRFMLDDAARVPFKFCFGAPSCVPATTFETAGAALDVDDVTALLDDPRIGYLAEVMNYPGVLNGDEALHAMIAAAQQRGKPCDGHAPGLRGQDARRYFAAGITTDHECFTLDEALDKLGCHDDVKIVIREGSAARNFEALWPLIDRFPGRIMLCSDDKHPDDFSVGHINGLCARAVAKGCDLFNVLRAACLVPVEHYRLRVGQLREGDPADFVEVDSLEGFRVRRTWIDGEPVMDDDRATFALPDVEPINQFLPRTVSPSDFALAAPAAKLRAIVAEDGQLVTGSREVTPTVADGRVQTDPANDLLKLTVVNRYDAAPPPAVALIQGFGLQRGAIASSVAHDSHNVLAVGVDDASLAAAVNAVTDARGGLSVCDGSPNPTTHTLPLPVAGLMSTESLDAVAARYEALDAIARQLGTPLRAPFMTLGFMALLVIPSLKLSDQGLFDGERFSLVGDMSPR